VGVSRGRFIYLVGADGTGKSTQARLLLDNLRQLGSDPRHLWLRFPFFFSLPLLAYARLRGYSWHEVTNGVKHGYWDFRRSWLMSRVFPLALLVDATLVSLYRVRLPLHLGRTILCERYVLDMLIDLQLGTHRPLLDSWERRAFLRLLPGDALVIGLAAPEAVVIRRRADLQHDRLLADKLSTYTALFRQIACPVIPTVQPEWQAQERILKIIFAD
jgi:thymidylate kinase